MKEECERIRDQCVRAWEGGVGGPWYGTCLEDILDGVSAVDAAARPLAGAHTVWELVLHMTAWRREVLRRAQGGSPGLPAEGDWPPVPPEPSAEAWGRALTAWRDAGRALLAHLGTLDDAALFQRLPAFASRTTEPGTPYFLYHGILQHDIYHGGQVALLRRGFDGNQHADRRAESG